jgi:hypothetical protein
MKKLSLLALTVFFLLLVPISTFAGTSRLVAVRMGGGHCGGTITIVTDHFNDGGQRRIAVRLIGPGGIFTETTRLTSQYGNVTLNWQFDSSDYVVGNTVLRARVGFDGQYRMYYFDCTSMELSQQEVHARNNIYADLQRETTYDFYVTNNDASGLPISHVTIIPFNENIGSAVVVDYTTVRLTTGSRIGSWGFTYRACNIANNCDTAIIYFNTLNVAPTCDAVEGNIYYWQRDVLEAPFIGANGVEDPEGDPMTLEILSLTNAGASPDGGTFYDIEFTVEDAPPVNGIPLSCSGTVRVQKED